MGSTVIVRRAYVNLLVLEGLLCGVLGGALTLVALKKFVGAPAPITHALSFFVSALVFFPALAVRSELKGAPIGFLKYAAIFFGSSVLLMWLSSLG